MDDDIAFRQTHITNTSAFGKFVLFQVTTRFPTKKFISKRAVNKLVNLKVPVEKDGSLPLIRHYPENASNVQTNSTLDFPSRSGNIESIKLVEIPFCTRQNDKGDSTGSAGSFPGSAKGKKEKSTKSNFKYIQDAKEKVNVYSFLAGTYDSALIDNYVHEDLESWMPSVNPWTGFKELQQINRELNSLEERIHRIGSGKALARTSREDRNLVTRPRTTTDDLTYLDCSEYFHGCEFRPAKSKLNARTRSNYTVKKVRVGKLIKVRTLWTPDTL